MNIYRRCKHSRRSYFSFKFALIWINGRCKSGKNSEKQSINLTLTRKYCYLSTFYRIEEQLAKQCIKQKIYWTSKLFVEMKSVVDNCRCHPLEWRILSLLKCRHHEADDMKIKLPLIETHQKFKSPCENKYWLKKKFSYVKASRNFVQTVIKSFDLNSQYVGWMHWKVFYCQRRRVVEKHLKPQSRGLQRIIRTIL